MSFKSIFNWLYGATLDRAMSVQQPTNIQRISNLSPTVRPILPLLVTLVMLTLGVGNAWGATVTYNATNSSFSDKDATPYVITQDSVDFKLYIPNWYNNGNNGHFYVWNSNNDANVKWTPNTGFSIAVTGISFYGRNAYTTWGLSKFNGKSYIKSYSSASCSYNTAYKIGENRDEYTANFTTSNTTVFPGGVALGNNDYFNVYSRNNKDKVTDEGNSVHEYTFDYVTITYMVTPPAPTLINGSVVTCPRYIEGRSNNTVTLTDYFKPFHEGDDVSMSYEVKKKNSSGEYVTINSEYTITSDVFKTTYIGEYQIRAKSNATGAFVVSGWSEPIVVTIEEVQALTVSVGSQELYVDGTTTMTITEQLNTTNPVVFDYDENFFDYNSSTGALTIKNDENDSFNTIEKSIHITQESDGEFAAVDMYKTFKIKKYANALTSSTGSWTNDLLLYEEVNLFSNNTGAPLTVTRTSGDADVTTYDAVNKKIVANFREGTATWTVSQAEDYKYQAATPQTLTVTVGTLPSPGCMLLENQSDTEHGMYGNTYHEHTWDAEHAAGVVSFEISKNPAGINQGYKVQQYLDNDGDGNWTWEDVTDYKNDHSTSWGDWKSETLNVNAKGIRFMMKGSVDNYVRNVSVTRKAYVDTKNTSGATITSLTMPSRTISGAATTATFYVDYSTCADEIKVASDNAHITVSDASFASTTAGRKAITLTYNSDVAEDIAATVTIYTPYEHKTLTVNAETVSKLSTELRWKEGVSTTYSVDHANMAATDLFEVRDANGNVVPGAVITLSKNETSAIDIVSDDKVVDFKCGGSATITAHYAGDNTTYQAASDLEQAITITRLADVISFNDAKASMVVGEELDITGWVSALSESSITVSPLTSSYLVLEGNTLRAVGKGQGKLQAVSAGNCTYNSGTKTLDILVRNPNDPCKHPLLYNSGTLSVGNNGGDNNKILPIDDGPQDTLTFKVWKYSGLTTGNSPKVTFLDANGGEIASEEFSGLSTSEPTNPNVIIDLKNNKYHGTKKLKFSAPSTFNQYFGEIKVSQQTYLTASTTSVTMSTVKACVQATGQFNISYSDLSRLQLSQTNENFTYEVWQGDTKLNGFSNDCGDYGTYTVKFFYTPQTVGDYSNTVTISASGKEQVITLSGTANAPEREIVWNIPTGNTISATQSVDLTAYAQTGCESPAGSVYYTYSPAVDGAATIDGARITFNKAATITVTAHTVTSDMYEDATAVDKVWTVGKVGTQMKTLPTITSTITYGDNSSVVTHNNTFTAVSVLDNTHEVAGSIAYVSPTNFTAAGEMNLIFTFTPTIEWDVYEPIQFTVPVTVLQKTSVATPSAANIVYGQKVSESELSNSGTEGTWTWNTENNEAVLDAGTHEDLAVHFTPTSSNYTELDGTVSLTVLKAEADATPAVAAITYGQKVSEAALTNAGATDGAWALVGVNADEVKDAGSYELDVHFTPTSGNYNEKDAVVTLTVNKAASEATPSAPAIVAGQKVSESALTNSGTAGTWAWDAEVANITPAAGIYNYTVHFTPENANYTELTTTVQLQVNVPVYNFTNAKGDGNWDDPSNWEGGSVPDNNLDVIISGNLTINDSRTIGDLTIEDGASVQVVVSGNLTVTGASEVRDGYGDLVIANGGEVNVTGTLNVHDLVIASKSCTDGTSISGQLTGESNITNVDGDVYIDITLVEGALDDSQWYGFTVPFEVDAEHGVYRYENGNVVGPLTWGNQYDIANYDSNKRYNTGKGWQYYRGTLNPGEFYYITLDGTYNVYRFKKKASSAISSGNTKSLNLYGANPASKDANWNPVGNPTLTYTITDYNGYVQIYQNGQSAYKAVPASEAAFVVGCPFFIQAAEAGTLTLNEGTKNQLYAPARGEEKAFNISMQAETGGYADNIYLNTSDEADGTYRVGHDLLKAGTSKLVPQLWIAQGEDKLCVNEAELNNNNAYATLGLYAPTTGNYVLDIVDAPQDATLYLTYDGTVIWNLSESAYTLSLMKGTTSNYGLQLVREARNTATGVEQVGSETQLQKFVHNGVLYINKDGVLYDAMGKKVK